MEKLRKETSPIPIISVHSVRQDYATTTMTPTTLSCSRTDLPLRCRNESAVVASPSGQVRRMRSVLDIRLGSMSAPIDLLLAVDENEDKPSDDSNNTPSPICCLPRDDGILSPASLSSPSGSRDTLTSDSDDTLSSSLMRKLVLNRGNCSDIGSTPPQTPLRSSKSCNSDDVIQYDVFGIPIPTRSNSVFTNSSNAPSSVATTITGGYESHDDVITMIDKDEINQVLLSQAVLNPDVTNDNCSVLIAESPSRLDLSALLCWILAHALVCSHCPSLCASTIHSWNTYVMCLCPCFDFISSVYGSACLCCVCFVCVCVCNQLVRILS